MTLTAPEGGAVSQSYIENMRRKLEIWLKTKGLQNVEIMITSGVDINITKMTVNDVFEETVLKGDNNG